MKDNDLIKETLLDGVNPEEDPEIIEPVDPRQEMLEEYRRRRDERDKLVAEARENDKHNAKLDNYYNAFGKIGEGLASGPLTQDIKMAGKVGKYDSTKSVKEDSDSRIKGLMDEYKLLQGDKKDKQKKKYFSRTEGVVEVDPETSTSKIVKGTEKKIDEQEKAKPNEFDKALSKHQAKKYVDVQEKGQQAQADDNMIDDTLTSFLDYSKSNLTGTGPLATLGGLTKYASKDTENLDAKFKNLGLSKMVKMFAGMSKAVDSDAERRAFESTVASITNDDDTNAKILLGAKAVNLRNKAEAKAQQKHLLTNPNMSNYESPIMSKPTSVVVDPKTGKLRLIPREQLAQAKKQGFKDLDEYSSIILGN